MYLRMTSHLAARSAAAFFAVYVRLAAAGIAAESPLEQATRLLEHYDEDPARVDRAREVLEAALATPDDGARADTLTLSARVYFLIGDLRAHDDAAKIVAFDRGRELGRQAVKLAPDNAAAHLWYAIDLGRFAQTKGIVRSLMVLPTLRAEIDTVLRLDPRSGEGHVLAGALLRELPRFLGGDLDESEAHLRRAIALEPHRTGYRIELARLLIIRHREADARRELEQVLAEEHPADVPYTALHDRPVAREMLAAPR